MKIKIFDNETPNGGTKSIKVENGFWLAKESLIVTPEYAESSIVISEFATEVKRYKAGIKNRRWKHNGAGYSLVDYVWIGSAAFAIIIAKPKSVLAKRESNQRFLVGARVIKNGHCAGGIPYEHCQTIKDVSNGQWIRFADLVKMAGSDEQTIFSKFLAPPIVNWGEPIYVLAANEQELIKGNFDACVWQTNFTPPNYNEIWVASSYSKAVLQLIAVGLKRGMNDLVLLDPEE
jgi:hypothetical protein